ncbi:MAG: PilW family protein [Peptostreptococcaceae bacterium]
MNKKSNKGFTIVELLIAISIVTIVISMGYSIVNGTSKATRHQANVFSEQQAANLINKYITKDLEMCKFKEELNSTELDKYRNEYDSTYGYKIINGTDDEIKYVVGIRDSKYDLTRVASESSIKIAEKIAIKNDDNTPFTIEKDSIDTTYTMGNNATDRNIYNIKISSLDNVYEFKVTPRGIESQGDESGNELNGEGHIVLHETKKHKSVIISESDNNEEYTSVIKVSKNKNENSSSIELKEDKFNVKVDKYDKGIFSGDISINGKSKKLDDLDINNNDIKVNHEGMDIILRKESYKDKYDNDDDDLIIEIKKSSTKLIKLEIDKSENDLEVELYNELIEIKIDEDGEVEVEIGGTHTSKVQSAYGNDKEMDIEIDKQYINNIYGMFIESKQVDIKSVELNDAKHSDFSYIGFDPSGKKELDLELKMNNSIYDENMTIVRFSSKKLEEPVETIYGDLHIKRMKNGSENSLIITYPNGSKEEISIEKDEANLTIEAIPNSTGNVVDLKLLPTSKKININLGSKEAKSIQIVSKHNSQEKELQHGKTTKFEPVKLNPGGGAGNENDEMIIRIKGS